MQAAKFQCCYSFASSLSAYSSLCAPCNMGKLTAQDAL